MEEGGEGDVVRRMLVRDPKARLGAPGGGGYEGLKVRRREEGAGRREEEGDGMKVCCAVNADYPPPPSLLPLSSSSSLSSPSSQSHIFFQGVQWDDLLSSVPPLTPLLIPLYDRRHMKDGATTTDIELLLEGGGWVMIGGEGGGGDG